MQLRSHDNKSSVNRKAVALVSLLMAATGVGQVARAQGAAYGSYGADQDLLPPEVVPLDPATASSMSAQQAAQRQAQMSDGAGSAPSTGSIPGLVSSRPQGNSAQDLRRQAFESLYNQAPAQQPMGGQQMGMGMGMGNGYQAQGSAPMVQGEIGYTPPLVSNAPPPQSQTLVGASKKSNKIRDTRRGGFTNGLAAGATLGMGALMGGFYTQNPMGLGMYGLRMLGFGSRNAFR